jgi:hypothetical protein
MSTRATAVASLFRAPHQSSSCSSWISPFDHQPCTASFIYSEDSAYARMMGQHIVWSASIMGDEQRGYARVGSNGRHNWASVVAVNHVRSRRKSYWFVNHDMSACAHLCRQRPKQRCKHNRPMATSPQAIRELFDDHLRARPGKQSNVCN